MKKARTAVAAFGLLLLFITGCSHLNSSAEAQNPAPSPLQFVSQWGTKGADPGQLDDPQSMAVDSVGNVYIADAGNGFISKFTPNGTPLLSFQEGALKEPQSIAVDAGGAIYISDPARSMVYVVFPKSEHDYHRVLRIRTRPSSENSLSVSVDDEGTIHVLDENAGRVFTFSGRLRLLRTWFPSPVRLVGRKGPASIGPLHVNRAGDVFVADVDSNRLLRFDPSGHFVAEIPSSGAQIASVAESTAAAPAKPRISGEFAVSPSYIFVMDQNATTLHVWNLDGSPKLDVDLSPQLGQVHRPPALALGPQRDLFVLDSTNCRVLRYRINF